MTLGFAAMAVFTATVLLGRALGLERQPATVLGTSMPTAVDAVDGTFEPGVSGRLPGVVRESSGVAVASFDSGLLWTHNDGSEARLFLVRHSGTLTGIVQLVGKEMDDVEDIDVGPCPSSIDAPSCIYISDTGDNDRQRDEASVFVAAEPGPDAFSASMRINVAVEEVEFRYPDGPRDTEALAVTSDGSILIVTKGQEGSSDVFEIPWPTEDSDGDERAVKLAALPIDVDDKEARITAAAYDEITGQLLVRSDGRAFLLDLSDLTTFVATCELPDAGQGEGVDFLAPGLLITTREGRPAPIEIVRCP